MLHRLTLRVLPRLTLAVTEDSVRRRKRLVMLVPGLVAFAIYRIVKRADPLTDPFLLLFVSGLIAAMTALLAYRVGRRTGFAALWEEDGGRRLGWVTGWIGFCYGVQLSLMVLALLKILAGYDYLLHPDGPAMMAIIIACTSVARDAFEIGHVRRLQRDGQPILTFPDGGALRALVREQPGILAGWTLLAGLGGALLAVGLSGLGKGDDALAVQFALISLLAGSVALPAYLSGQQRSGGWVAAFGLLGWPELFRFWWWPGLAFAATYYLVLAGAVAFLVRPDPIPGSIHGLIGLLVTGIMALYCYYLGYRRALEDRIQQQVPTSLLRCPFVFGILSKTQAVPTDGVVPPAGVALGESGRQG
ncbi:MAG: hypothetical protein KGO52_06200 [Nitrospirota bacterium]|nr:hypothetical protein [Nitrospirota bacterium]MDE3242293.1 hypothetical protein [Nitrospirota bacterium]